MFVDIRFIYDILLTKGIYFLMKGVHKMKKVLALLIFLMLFCCCIPALAEDGTSDIGVEYEGVWYPLTELGLQVYLPYEWVVYTEEEDVYLMTGDGEGAQLMWIEKYQNTEGYTNESIFNEFTSSGRFENVYELDFTEVKLTCYEDINNEMLIAVTLSTDGANACFFYFSPNSLLAQQIITTVSTLGSGGGEQLNW